MVPVIEFVPNWFNVAPVKFINRLGDSGSVKFGSWNEHRLPTPIWDDVPGFIKTTTTWSLNDPDPKVWLIVVSIWFTAPPELKYLFLRLKSFNLCGNVGSNGYAKYLSSLLTFPGSLSADHKNGCGACKRYFSFWYNLFGLVEDRTSYPETILL